MTCPTTQTVLVVEDDVRMRQMIRSILHGMAVELVERDDGADAVTAYDQYMPDWVLMDIKLRSVDGLTATRRIVARHPQARIIIVTNYDSPGFKDEARFAGACGYVLKNHLVELRNIIETHRDTSAGLGL